MERYHRQVILPEFGFEGQKKLLRSSVLVIGAGGLGSPVIQYLAAAGVGQLGIADFDTVQLSNLQRQVIYNSDSIGKPKASEARNYVNALNNGVRVSTHSERITPENISEVISDYQIVVDCTDTIPLRYLINDACLKMGIPWVYGAIFKFQGQVSVFNYNNGPTYRCLFPTPPDHVESCNTAGVIGVLPGITGTLQAMEVIKIITGIGEVCSGKLSCFDTLTNQTTLIRFKKNEKEVEKVMLQGLQAAEYNDLSCETAGGKISLDRALSDMEMTLIDLRERDELPGIEHPRVMRLPWSDFQNNMNELEGIRKMAFFCRAGLRSQKAWELINKNSRVESYYIADSASSLAEALLNKTSYENHL